MENTLSKEKIPVKTILSNDTLKLLNEEWSTFHSVIQHVIKSAIIFWSSSSTKQNEIRSIQGAAPEKLA
jgi:hypothetical protein